MMKIKLFIAIDNLGPGGTQRQLIEYLKYADRTAFDISIINLDKKYATLSQEIQALGFRIIGIDHKGLFNLRTLLTLIRLFKREKPDIVHTYLFTADLYGRVAAWLSCVPVILSSVRGLDLDKNFRQLLADTVLSKITDTIIINAENIRPYLLNRDRINPSKIRLIYNGLELARFDNLKPAFVMRNEFGIPKDAFVVGMVARFDHPKDYTTFIRTAKIVISKVPNVYFIAVGDGPLRGQIEELASTLLIKKNIVFTGLRKDVPDLINSFDLGFFASLHEGCSNAILEYMSCAKPVVATAVGGCSELVIDGKNGFLANAKAENELAERVIQLLLEPELRSKMGKEGRAIIESRFNLEIMVGKTEALYHELLKPKVAFILSQFPCYDETFILRELTQLKENGLNYLIYSIKPCRDKIVHEAAEKLVKDTRYLPLFSLRLFLINLWFLLRHPIRYLAVFVKIFFGNLKSPNFFIKSVGLFPQAVAFAWQARKEKITHVHGQWATYPATYAMVISRLNNIPFSFTGHAHDIFMDTTMLAQKIKAARFVTTCTQDNKRYLAKILQNSSLEDRIIVNHHGVDFEKFKATDRLEDARGKILRILSVGSLFKSKGFDILIDACKLLKDKGLDFECTIAGGGTLENNLKDQVNKLGLEEKIKFTGYLKQKDIIPLYKQTNIFVLPVRLSMHWGIPNVLIEAMACKVPVITTALPSISEIIENNKDGFIIPEENPQVLAELIFSLANDYSLRQIISEAGYSNVIEKFDLKQQSASLMDLFDAQLEGRRVIHKPIGSLLLRRLLSSIVYVKKISKPSQGIPVLTYHRIDNNFYPGAMDTPVANFERQMKFLFQNGYKAIGVKELLENLKQAQPADPTGKKVVITFDDGRKDSYTSAFPILKKYGFKATVFLTIGRVIKQDKLFLTPAQIKEMAEYGIEFGAHTVNHPHLSRLPLGEAKREIDDSRILISELTGTSCDAFCYPYGDFNAQTQEIVKECGFNCAFSESIGKNLPYTDLFALKRTEISGLDSLFDFKKKLAGAFDPLHRLSNKLCTPHSVGRTNKRINILYVIWSLGLGGAERALIELVKGLDKAKFTPIVCCLNDKGVFAQELEENGIKVIALNKKRGIDFSVIGKISSIIKKNRIDIVHTHMWGGNLWGRIAAKLSRVPVVIATEQNVDTWKRPYHFVSDKLLGKYTDTLVAVSENVKDFYAEKTRLNRKKIKVIYNSVNLKKYEFSDSKRLDFIGNREITLGIIGRLVPQKGHRDFILAVKELLKDCRVKGIVVGSGPLENELKEFSQNLGLNGNIVFIGLRQDIPELLKSIDILILPSLREGLPLTVLEAMACGVPVVATKVGGTPEVVINNHTGILIEPKDYMAIKDAVLRFMKDKDFSQQIVHNARKMVEEKFSAYAMARQHSSLYEELLFSKLN
ncbi:MAG: glycosyltransferase [Candidatus Omnitrophica bacterium]|nr:glycosyltransferase [Candidatus Omnitrophota bacterium]